MLPWHYKQWQITQLFVVVYSLFVLPWCCKRQWTTTLFIVFLFVLHYSKIWEEEKEKELKKNQDLFFDVFLCFERIFGLFQDGSWKKCAWKVLNVPNTIEEHNPQFSRYVIKLLHMHFQFTYGPNTTHPHFSCTSWGGFFFVNFDYNNTHTFIIHFFHIIEY